MSQGSKLGPVNGQYPFRIGYWPDNSFDYRTFCEWYSLLPCKSRKPLISIWHFTLIPLTSHLFHYKYSTYIFHQLCKLEQIGSDQRMHARKFDIFLRNIKAWTVCTSYTCMTILVKHTQWITSVNFCGKTTAICYHRRIHGLGVG